jgi:hypothetical protein
MYRFVCALFTAVVFLLAGCAGTGQQARDSSGESFSPIDLQARTELPLADAVRLADSDNLVETDVRAGIGGDLVEFRTRYSVSSGELVRNVGKSYQQGQSIPTQLARQSVEHAVRFSTPGHLGAPVRVGFDQREAAVLTLNGQQRRESTRAHLVWEPDPVRLQLEWTPPRRVASAGNPLDCTLEGRLRMPTERLSAGYESVLDVSQSECMVRAPNRGVDQLPMQARGLAWNWGESLGSAIHMSRVELRAPVYGMPELKSGYEMGLRQKHSLFGWQMEADVALRQAEAPMDLDEAADDESRWTVDLQLRRQLHAFALTARWMQAKDPLWFVPEASPVGRQSVSLLLDFSSWLTDLMPGMEAGMRASWRHSEDAQGRDDNHFRWDFSLSW